MKLDAIILQIAVVFLPGIIWARLDARYALTSKPTDTEFLIRSFVFGICSYAATFALYSLFGRPFVLVDFNDKGLSNITNSAIAIEILSAIVVGLFLSIIWIYAATYKWLSKFLQSIHATRKYGDEDVWDFTFNSKDAWAEYVHFRDFENKIVYAGWVRSFSETEKLRELFLSDVEVYDFEGKKLFGVPRLYLARAPENLHVEFPYVGLREGKDDEQRKQS